MANRESTRHPALAKTNAAAIPQRLASAACRSSASEPAPHPALRQTLHCACLIVVEPSLRRPSTSLGRSGRCATYAPSTQPLCASFVVEPYLYPRSSRWEARVYPYTRPPHGAIRRTARATAPNASSQRAPAFAYVWHVVWTLMAYVYPSIYPLKLARLPPTCVHSRRSPRRCPLSARRVAVLCLSCALARSSTLSCAVVAIALLRCFTLSARYLIVFVMVTCSN